MATSGCDVTIMLIFYSWRRWLPCVMYELCVFFTAEEDGNYHVWCYNYVYFLQLKMATPMCYILIVCTFYSCRWWQLCVIFLLHDFLQLQMATSGCDVTIMLIFYSWRWWLPCVMYELCVFFTAEEDGDSHVWCYNYVYFLQLKMATPMCYVLIVWTIYSCRWWQLCVIF
jgi:hypothetical protein